VRVLLLGTAAGGGLPQWNCACDTCSAARAGTVAARGQDCVAVSGNDRDWWLLNASPDIRTQLAAAPRLAPGPGPRDTPVRGVLLSDAELDHVLGLLVLREAGALRVHAPEAVCHALAADFGMRGVLGAYAGWDWHTAVPGEPFELAGGLMVDAVPVGAKRPRYAAGSTAEGPWVVAYRVRDTASGGVLVYAPCLAAWPPGFGEIVAGAHCLLLDGTFHRGDEMRSATGDARGQQGMGHLPIAGDGGSLAALRDHPWPRRVYTHLNNTNPVADPRSAAHAELVAAGAEVLPDGAELVL
jgi:pyrroloquinoline quinone biosynthesis protein B